MSAERFLIRGGPAKARAYVKKRMADALALRKELNAAYDVPDKAHQYLAATLYQGQVQVRNHLLWAHPFAVIVPVAASGTREYPVMTETQVLAYILARFW